jgi:hypothetical protein
MARTGSRYAVPQRSGERIPACATGLFGRLAFVGRELVEVVIARRRLRAGGGGR